MNTTGTPVKLPDWIAGQRRDRSDCERCGQEPGITEWAGTGELLGEDCLEKRHAAYAERIRNADAARRAWIMAPANSPEKDDAADDLYEAVNGPPPPGSRYLRQRAA